MNLQEFLAKKFQTQFEFTRIEKTQDSNGKTIAVFYLKEPIPEIEGSRMVGDGTGDAERIKAYDVTTVRMHESEMGLDDGVEINDDGTGTVQSNLFLDVTEAGDVQLRRDTLLAFGNKRRNEVRGDRRAGAYNKMQEKKAQFVLKNASATSKSETPIPESVATGGAADNNGAGEKGTGTNKAKTEKAGA